MKKRAERRRRVEEKNAALYARMAERTKQREAARIERLARRRRMHKRWRMTRPDTPAVKAQHERARAKLRLSPQIIGEPGSPYELAVSVVERESGEARGTWEMVLRHPNNVQVNELARRIAINELTQSDMYRLNANDSDSSQDSSHGIAEAA